MTWGDSDVGGDSSHVQDQLFEVLCSEIRLPRIKLVGMATATAYCWHERRLPVSVFGVDAGQLDSLLKGDFW